jgi:hypothetical protein
MDAINTQDTRGTRASWANTNLVPEFLTDEQLCQRWHCSKMKLYRLRQRGILKAPVKIGNAVLAKNLTRLSDVLDLENSEAA